MITFNQRLLSDINDYCELNNLDPNVFANGLLKKAFMIEKYGDRPPIFDNTSNEDIKEKEPIIEKKRTTKNKKEEKDKSIQEIIVCKDETSKIEVKNDISEDNIDDEPEIEQPKKRRKLK